MDFGDVLACFECCVCDGWLFSCLMLLSGVAGLKRCLLIVLLVAVYVIKFAHLCVLIGFFNLVVCLMWFVCCG